MKIAKLAAALVLATAMTGTANAAYTINLEEYTDATGSRIIGTGSGSFNTTGLTEYEGFYLDHTIEAEIGRINLGLNYSGRVYGGIKVPAIFPSQSQVRASMDIDTYWPSGPLVGVIGYVNEQIEAQSGASQGSSLLIVPDNYVSGTELGLSKTVFWGSFAKLGLTNGSYVYSWGSGANADTLTVNVGPVVTSAIPESSTWAMMLVGFGLIAATARYRRCGVQVTYV